MPSPKSPPPDAPNETSAHSSPANVYVGPAGWSYPDWAGFVYPLRRTRGFHELSYLAQFFDTIEINTSFYQPLRPEHSRQWLARVAENPRFLFTAKLWQRFTHDRRSLTTASASAEEREARAGFDILRSANRLGAVLLQFPFSFHRTAENVSYLSTLLERFADYPLAVEVRHGTWDSPETLELLRTSNASFCNIDQPLIGCSLAPSAKTTSAVGYVRLHGRRYDTWFTDDARIPPHERYNYLYSAEELEPWVARVRKVSQSALATFVITNNHFQGKAVVNALQLIHILKKAKVPVPDPLRRQYPEIDSIAENPPAEPLLFPMKK